MDAYAEGLTQTKTMLRDFFGVPEENFLDWKEDSSAQPMIAMFVPEYPELEGGDALHVLTVSDNVCNSALWKTYRNKVMSMSDNIDVWYMSPATKLFQDPVSRAVIGVEIDKAGETVNIRAKNGVVMTMGGFENNKQMVEDFLGLTKSTPAGTLFNTGDGVKMAMGVGADLWHMEAYEGNCFALGGISFVVNEDQHAKTFNDLRNLSGSVIVVGNGGERYLREDVYNRHGHVPSNGDWVNVKRPRNTYMVWDAAQNEAIAEYHGIPAGFEDQVVSAATIAELEAALGIPAGKLEQTVTDFNKMANDGYDPAFFRAAETMRAFGEGPFYAIEMIQAFLNTQGGARRNARAEVVGTDGRAHSAPLLRRRVRRHDPVPVQRRRQHGPSASSSASWPAWARRPRRIRCRCSPWAWPPRSSIPRAAAATRSIPIRPLPQSSARTSISAPPPCAWATSLP